jgi:hypothetical protein
MVFWCCSKRRLAKLVMGKQKAHQIHAKNVESWQEEM